MRWSNSTPVGRAKPVSGFVEELGWSSGITDPSHPGPFDAEEAMDSFEITAPPFTACPGSTFTPAGPNVLIEIENLSGHDWPVVWYVADVDTTICL